MRQKITVLVLLALLAVSCNKDAPELKESPFAVFPNPCRGQVSVVFTGQQTGDISCSLFDPAGSLVVRVDDFGPGQQLNLALGSAGIYYVEVFVNNVSYREKVLNLD
ncbi:MAG: T9SS type A sorting domain-containing protein [Lewinellaceae bacterium]|jgi:hypothetical protein|nr:T9SS type A sorting domain-containing protein [Lewinellaceae bacterium]